MAASQGIRDSVFNIREVRVMASPIFKKEVAGMKETCMDSMAMMNKLSLSLSDLLSENTSVFIKSEGRGALATASFRGTAASHTRVTWNGMNINSPMTGMVDFSLIPVYVIDDMSLKHGAASIADQSGGLGGSVNISNKVDWNNRTEVKYTQGIGSFSTYDEFLQLALGNKTIQFKTRLYHNFSQNDYTYINRTIGHIDPETGNIVNPLDTNSHAGYKRYGMMQEFYFRPGINSVFSVKWWGQRSDRTIPRATSYEGDENSNLNNSYDKDDRVLADWNFYGSRSKLMLRAGYSAGDMLYTLKNVVPGRGLVAGVYAQNNQHNLLNAASFSYDINKRISLESSLTADFHRVSTRDTVTKTGYDKNRRDVSLMLALHYNMTERLNLNLMLRKSAYDRSFVPITPFLGFDFRMIPGSDLLLKGSVARNYHQPALNDLYWQPGGNPNLLAEEGTSFELGLEYQHLWQKNKLNAELTAYRTDIDNWIIRIPGFQGNWDPLNVKRVLSRGLEFSSRLNGFWGQLGYSVSANYAYTSSVNYGDPLVWGDESYGKQLVYVPLHSGNVISNLSFRDFFVTWQHNTFSERFTTSSNDVSKRNRLYPYYMNDVSVGKRVQLNKVTLSTELKVFNLFNETYHTVLYRPMPGRNYHLLLMVRF